jgi:hypothetical protein
MPSVFLPKLIFSRSALVTLLIVKFLFPIGLFAQREKTPNFFGINPSITVEPYYNKGEFDVNILPLVWQKPLFYRMDLRLTSILNLGVRETGNVISHYGMEFAGVFLMKRKTEKSDCSSSWFAAPIISVSHNNIENRSSVGLWLEPGYAILFDNKFALSLGIQFGATSFISEQNEVSWGNHFGFKVVFGKWFP